MRLKRISFVILVAVLLAACTQAPGPVSSPIPLDPASNTPYPGPNTNNSTGETPYPGPDAPVNSDDPSTQNPYPDPLQALPGEEDMERGEVFIDQSEILTLESMPLQYVLHIVGNLPTPCHHLRAQISEPDSQNQIQVEIYSMVNPDEICTQVLKPFDTSLPLGGFETGTYPLLVNGEKVGEIEAP